MKKRFQKPSAQLIHIESPYLLAGSEGSGAQSLSPVRSMTISDIKNKSGFTVGAKGNWGGIPVFPF